MTERTEYIGDGVYVSDDGYQLWLAVNYHDNTVIALDPEVCLRLIQQMRRVVDVDEIALLASRMARKTTQ